MSILLFLTRFALNQPKGLLEDPAKSEGFEFQGMSG
jgi:hypothetical protein